MYYTFECAHPFESGYFQKSIPTEILESKNKDVCVLTEHFWGVRLIKKRKKKKRILLNQSKVNDSRIAEQSLK